ALNCADFVTIHVTGGESVRNMIAKPELKCMKKTAVLINTTRGFIINETDLIWALEQGIIAGAALDVFSEEPIQKDNPLLTQPQVIVSPHNAASTPEARQRAQEACAENIFMALEGQRPSFALN
ncbi:MAG: NAD(P)-dependent oxidoreductase, partial [Lachnospiraceae bacterium]|nr:NAD(P)-dependent oxidoreductase [Lachnospiraceae bacterium]